MFGTLISTDKQGNVKINDKYFHLCPELVAVLNDKNLGGPVIRYIINVYDRKSIYRHFPIDIRKEEVCMAIWGKKENPRLSHELVQKAIGLYEYVQYDPLIEQYNAMVAKNKKIIEVFNTIQVTEANISQVNKWSAEMQKSTEGLEKLRERIQAEEEEREIMGGGSDSLSYIEERLIRRQKEMNG
jgi:uncharacterized protein YeaO (DUF488 family)